MPELIDIAIIISNGDSSFFPILPFSNFSLGICITVTEKKKEK